MQLFGGYEYTESWIAGFALVGAVLQKAWFWYTAWLNTQPKRTSKQFEPTLKSLKSRVLAIHRQFGRTWLLTLWL
jgi:hypothetical protein